jgi:c-di-GMP-binding flagellar brake protein YcgR
VAGRPRHDAHGWLAVNIRAQIAPELTKNWEPASALVGFYPTSPEVPVHDRRLGFRIPFETMVTSYVHDRPVRGLATNLSDSGLSLSAISMLAPPPGMIVGLELDVPGVDDSIWAAAQVRYRQDDHLASGLGMRFVAMAKSHARLIREFCIEMRRKNLGALLARIRA